MIEIIGAEGEIKNTNVFLEKIKSFSEENNVEIAVLDAEKVFGKEHLLSAVEHTLRAFERKRNISNTLTTEILVYASCERQIKSAIEKMGIKDGARRVAFVVIDKTGGRQHKCEEGLHQKLSKSEKLLSFLHLIRNDSVLENDINALKDFGVTENEINSVHTPRDLILERIA
ncbi:MAG: KEOPS complex subunit Cgi121, partial [Candidatus Thermoplasmatota archaeon]|nr:KEOPS complex subunit Cgi121 [Candidatus Thermoplasmatota archaeon]